MEVGGEGGSWIEMIQDVAQWRVLVLAVLSPWFLLAECDPM
jgi:hypothetical protein